MTTATATTVCVELCAPIHVAVDMTTGKIVSVQVDDEGVEIDAGDNTLENIEVNDRETFELVDEATRERAIKIVQDGDWPAWVIGVED